MAEDRAGFAIEVLAARGQTAGATLALSDMHKTAGQQLVALANGNFDDSGAQSSSSGQSDPRPKVYAIDQLLAAKHAYTAFQLGYPATDAELFE